MVVGVAHLTHQVQGVAHDQRRLVGRLALFIWSGGVCVYGPLMRLDGSRVDFDSIVSVFVYMGCTNFQAHTRTLYRPLTGSGSGVPSWCVQVLMASVM